MWDKTAKVSRSAVVTMMSMCKGVNLGIATALLCGIDLSQASLKQKRHVGTFSHGN